MLQVILLVSQATAELFILIAKVIFITLFNNFSKKDVDLVLNEC